MKKTATFLTYLLFILTIIYPIGTLTTTCFGYNFKLISVFIFTVIQTILSLCVLILSIIFKNILESKATKILLVIIAPLSLINAVFCIFECPQSSVTLSTLFSACCCCFLSIKHGKPSVLKIVSVGLSLLLALPLETFCAVMLTFGNIAQNTVVQTLESPSGKYYAQVIDSDQGALGGDTLVDVYEKSGIDVLLFKIEKKPQRVYFGEWGEFENIKIYWKDDNCLVINSSAHKIE